MRFKTSTTIKTLIRLFNSTTGLPATAIAFGAVTATALKADGSTASITVNGSTWTEVTTGAFSGQGVYLLDIGSGVTNQAGLFGYSISSAGVSSFVGWLDLLDQYESDIYNRIGAPVGASISADIAGVQTTASSINTKIGTPAVTIATDIANVRGADNRSLTDITGTGWTSVTDTLHQIGSTVTSGGAGPSVASIVAGVWDEVLTGHTVANSAAVDLKLTVGIKAKTDLLPSDPASQAAILGPQSINLSSIAGGTNFLPLADNLHTINANINLIPVTTWDFDLSSYVSITNKAGYRLSSIKVKTDNLPTTPSSQGDVQAARDSVKGSPALSIRDIAGAGWSSSTDTLEQIEASITAGGVSPAVIAAAVWDEALSGHTTVGTGGERLTSTYNKAILLPSVPASQSDVTAARDSIKGSDNRNLTQLAGTGWISGTDNLHQIYLKIPAAAPAASTIASLVWDEDMTSHTVAGTSGRIIQDTRDTSDNIYSRIGAPVGASISADIAGSITSIKGTGNRSITDLAGSGWVSGTDNLHQIYAALPGAAPTAVTIANAVWDTVMSGHVTSGTAGKVLQDAKSAAVRGQTLLEGRWTWFTTGPNANQVWLYDKDGTTVLQKWTTKDASGTSSTASVFDRIPLLTIP